MPSVSSRMSQYREQHRRCQKRPIKPNVIKPCQPDRWNDGKEQGERDTMHRTNQRCRRPRLSIVLFITRLTPSVRC